MSLVHRHNETTDEVDACGFTGCRREDNIEIVTNGEGMTRAVCPDHKKEHLGVSS